MWVASAISGPATDQGEGGGEQGDQRRQQRPEHHQEEGDDEEDRQVLGDALGVAGGGLLVDEGGDVARQVEGQTRGAGVSAMALRMASTALVACVASAERWQVRAAG